ncbi:uncharacterized protein C8Q71DRAFT_842903 [Rhodofomes roseus]|uniref:DUF6535 domain-containing protein n=1 Tax=Rhodofomes roseus TaxID=34475 RepID=A0ABQ8K0Z8_9APHY|nr:uncharacterized protein C8Q71DRAFT_842903 [Rhodofomes roseus]KAH9830360.1 hypothetical protein C8Q71DRAFT_842903 [Rhodofomes roseus]
MLSLLTRCILTLSLKDAVAYDYEKKYEPDPPFQGAGPRARIWQVYGDEADEFDSDMIGRWKDSINVFLVFVGLFSGTVTSFLLHSASALQDPTTINSYLLAELIAVQRAAANGASLANVDPSPYGPGDPTGKPTDVWVNALWISSLTIAVSSALFAALVKQWLQRYESVISGSQRERVLVRQYRFNGLRKWKVATIIDVLPIFLQVAVFLFLAGLAVFYHPLNADLSYLVIAFAGATLLIYTCVNFLPVIYPDCVFKTPISEHLSIVLRYARSRFVPSRFARGWLVRLRLARLRLGHRLRWLARAHARDTYLEERRLKNELEQQDENVPSFTTTTKDGEREQVKDATDQLVHDSLVWLSHYSGNPSIPGIIAEAVAGMPSGLFCATLNGTGSQTRLVFLLPVAYPGVFDANFEVDLGAVMSRAMNPVHRDGAALAASVPTLEALLRLEMLDASNTVGLDWAMQVILRNTRSDRRLPLSMWLSFATSLAKAVQRHPSLTFDHLRGLMEVAGPTFQIADPKANSLHLWSMPGCVTFREIADDIRTLLCPTILDALRAKAGPAALVHANMDMQGVRRRLNGYAWPAVFKAFGCNYPAFQLKCTDGYTYKYEPSRACYQWSRNRYWVQGQSSPDPSLGLYDVEVALRDMHPVTDSPATRRTVLSGLLRRFVRRVDEYQSENTTEDKESQQGRSYQPDVWQG